MITERQMVHLALLIDIIAGEDTKRQIATN